MTTSSSRTLMAVSVLPAAALFAVAIGLACGERGGPSASRPLTLTIGAYTTPREAYGQDLLPAFAERWRAATGNSVTFEESYLGSGAQARAIVNGFEADIAALSLEPDIESLAKAGLLSHDWRATPHAGMVSRSVVVIAVRPGNPKGITTWDDLARPGVEVVTPNPRTSGGAMWNVAALYGAALRGATRAPAGDSAAAEQLLRGVLANVRIMDKGARESMITFETGVGDAAITYENEVIAARRAGKAIDYVIPTATIVIENPVAVIDTYVEKHGTRTLAEDFVTFLGSPAAQRMFAAHGFRPVDETIGAEFLAQFPAVEQPFTIRDLGGWPTVTATLFGDSGVFARAAAAAGR